MATNRLTASLKGGLWAAAAPMMLLACFIFPAGAVQADAADGAREQIELPMSDRMTLVARVLATFDMPAEITLDPLSDNNESMAATRAVEEALKARGIRVRDGAEYVLEIEVDPAATSAYRPRGQDATQANGFHAQRRDNPVDELAPSPELAPRPYGQDRKRMLTARPQLSVILILYKRQTPPVWMSQASMERDDRDVDGQANRLSKLSMKHFGESAAIGFRDRNN